MAERDEHQQSSGCSACEQLGQTPTPEHLAGVARFDARQQAATGDHRQNDEYPAFCRCLSRWPCELAADELAAEVTRLRKRVAAYSRRVLELERERDELAEQLQRHQATGDYDAGYAMGVLAATKTMPYQE